MNISGPGSHPYAFEIHQCMDEIRLPFAMHHVTQAKVKVDLFCFPSIVLLEQLRTVSKQRLEGDIEKGARFIAVNDNVDTINNTSSMDITPFKHILNDMYAKDISTK